MSCWKLLLRSAVCAGLLLGCASGGQNATGGSGGEGDGGTGGATKETGGSGGVATGGASGGSDGTGGAPMPDASTGDEPDAGLAADSAPPKMDRPPMSSGPGKIVLVAGGGNGGDGSPAVMASTNKPFGAVVDPLSGDVYIAEYGGHKVRRIDGKGIISTVMGAGASGPGSKIALGQPHNLIFQPNSHILFVADTFAGRVIRMDATTGESEVFASGLGRAYCLGFDSTGEHLYVNNGSIIDVKTKMMTKVGIGSPRVIAVDSKENVYFGGGASLSVADPMGKISAVMGSGGLSAPKHLYADLNDDILIADTESNTIRKYVVATKSVVKIAGGGGGMLDGDPNMAKLARPHGISVDGQGRIWIADSFNDRVLRIDY
jgi:DNA-binding beta-propeller fold protein YncE